MHPSNTHPFIHPSIHPSFSLTRYKHHYSLASGVTDRSDHSNSSHTTVVEKFAYKDGGRRVRPSREPTTTDGHHMDKHHDHKVHHHHDHHHDKHITKTAASSITKGTKTVSSHNNHVDQTTMDKMKINHSDKTASLSSSSCKGTSSSSSSLEEGSSGAYTKIILLLPYILLLPLLFCRLISILLILTYSHLPPPILTYPHLS